MNECSSLEGLVRLKFDHTSCDPLNGEPINFVEMLNQSFSDLVVLKAAEDLLVRFPGKKFELHMGALAGYDILKIQEIKYAAKSGTEKTDSEFSHGTFNH